MERLNLSARAYDLILKIARTIADLENTTEVSVNISVRLANTEVWTERVGWGKGSTSSDVYPF